MGLKQIVTGAAIALTMLSCNPAKNLPKNPYENLPVYNYPTYNKSFFKQHPYAIINPDSIYYDQTTSDENDTIENYAIAQIGNQWYLLKDASTKQNLFHNIYNGTRFVVEDNNGTLYARARLPDNETYNTK